MAGSYRHVTSDDGSFRAELLDDLGDAYEAGEEMHYMIRWLAKFDKKRIVAAEHAFLLATYPHHIQDCARCRGEWKEA